MVSIGNDELKSPLILLSWWCYSREWQMLRWNKSKYSKCPKKIMNFSLCHNRSFSHNLRVHTYEACIRIVLLYIFEMWSGKEEEVMHTLKNENAISWWMCCRKCFLPSVTQLCSILYLCNIGDIFRCNRLKWCGHIFCMEENQWPEQTIKFHVEGLLPRKKAF